MDNRVGIDSGSGRVGRAGESNGAGGRDWDNCNYTTKKTPTIAEIILQFE